MKKIVLYLVVLLISSCRSESEIAILIEQARWGDGQACLKLADRYRDGKGLKQDFLGMVGMASKAEELGVIDHMEEYLKTMPEESNFKLFFDATEKYAHRQTEEAWTLAEQLIANGSPDGYFVQGLITGERGDTLEGKRLMEKSASLGSAVAEFFLCLPEDSSTPDIERLFVLSDKVPYVKILLARLYRGERQTSLKNDSLAADCLLKADQQGFLGRKDAEWLLDYCKNGGEVQLTEKDVRRLQKLSGEGLDEKGDTIVCCTSQRQATIESTEKPASAAFNDEALERAISGVLKEKMMEKECETGTVYVVETSTGHIKANVSLKRKGRSFVPYKDTYAEEQSVMLYGPTYLALLSTGKCSPDDVIDTGNGIYKDLREHNWRSGGYGSISLERALGYRSHVAFAMTKDVVYEGRQEEFDEKMDTYLAGNPNHAMGILTFYNAVANGGKMVRLMTEGDGVTVLNEQIEAPEHIKTLKQGLRNAVLQGLCRRAGRDYTEVAACCRTFLSGKKTRRMEICGYFPASRPLYTIMVVSEKKNLSISATTMCAPIMASTIDILVESYGLPTL